MIEAADLGGEGPCVEVTLTLSGAAQTIVPSPAAATKATMLVDTGASHSMVKRGVLGPLGLHPVGTMDINTPSSQGVTCALYSVRMILPQGITVDSTVIEAAPGGLEGQNIDGLIGRDILQFGILIYQGRSNQFTMSF